jgi:hypothetical protein
MIVDQQEEGYVVENQGLYTYSLQELYCSSPVVCHILLVIVVGNFLNPMQKASLQLKL